MWIELLSEREAVPNVNNRTTGKRTYEKIANHWLSSLALNGVTCALIIV